MLVGACISLICFTILTFIPNEFVQFAIIAWVVLIGVVGYIIYCLNVERKSIKVIEKGITKVLLLNEENKTINEWDILGKISVVIGKGTKLQPVDIDLNNSIYSPLIDDTHAVLNYAEGSWYVEDLSIDKGVSIQKVENNERYNIVKGSPCTLQKGDIIYISKVKLLLQ